MKTHRLYRHSTRVSSETGVAYSAMIDYHHDIPSVKTKAMAELAKLAGLEEGK